MKKAFLLAGVALATAVMTGSAYAGVGQFNNGNFESGNFSGWEQGGGSWFGGSYPQSDDYFPGSGPTSITNVGFDANTGGNLRTVYAGAHSAQVNNAVNDYSVAVIRQTVTNYSSNLIAFAYAAVLESSHDTYDSDAFIITLKDITTGTTLFTKNVNSATASDNEFKQYGSWFYTDWTDVSIAVTAGNTYELSLLANDCPYGGHAGYAYLDGFGDVVGGGGTPPVGGVPEPSTWALLIGGFGMTGAAMRRRRQAAALS